MNYAEKHHRAVTTHVYAVPQIHPASPVLGSHTHIAATIGSHICQFFFSVQLRRSKPFLSFQEQIFGVVMPFKLYEIASSL